MRCCADSPSRMTKPNDRQPGIPFGNLKRTVDESTRLPQTWLIDRNVANKKKKKKSYYGVAVRPFVSHGQSFIGRTAYFASA